MTRPLVKEKEEKELRRLQAHLANTSKKMVALSKKEVSSLVDLIGAILTTKPIVIDSYVTPNEAAKLAGVSRPLLIEMLKRGALVGHMVGKHWRIKRESLIEYIANRDKAARATQAMDEDGFAFE